MLWFNFLAGFAYIVAGIALFVRHRAAVLLPFAILAATFLMLLAFGIHVLLGGAYEMRTVGAMILRAAVWLTIFMVALRQLGQSASSRI